MHLVTLSVADRPPRWGKLLASLALLCAGACGGDPAGPSGENPPPLIGNQLVELTHAVVDTTTFRPQIPLTGVFIIQLAVSSGQITAQVLDGDAVLRTLTLNAATGPTGFTETLPLVVASEQLEVRYVGVGVFRTRMLLGANLPEVAPRRLLPGVIISTESMRDPGDIDDFVFDGVAGDQVVMLLGTTHPGAAVRLQITGPSGALVAEAQGGGVIPNFDTDTPGSGRFTLGQTGEYRVRASAFPHDASAGSPYKLMLRIVDPGIEGAPDTLVLGDTTVNSRLDFVGDYDVVLVEGTPGRLANVLFMVDSSPSTHAVDIEVLTDTAETGVRLRSTGSTRTDSVIFHRAVGRFAVPPSGRFYLRVIAVAPDPGSGSYTFRVFAVDRAPESVPNMLVANDTVTAESADLPGDVDQFALEIAAGDTLNLIVDVDRNNWWAENHVIGLRTLIVPPGDPLPTLRESTALTMLPEVHDFPHDRVPWFSPGLQILDAGSYLVDISSTPSTLMGYVGAYRIRMYRISYGVEGGAATLAPDDLASSRLGVPGDVDVYSVTATPGQKLQLELTTPASVVPNCLGGALIVSDGGVETSSYVPQGPGGLSELVMTVPAGGAVRVSVSTCGPAGEPTDYTVRVLLVP